MSCHNLIEVRNEKLPLVPFNQYNFGWFGLVIHIITTKTPNSKNLFAFKCFYVEKRAVTLEEKLQKMQLIRSKIRCTFAALKNHAVT